MTEFLKDLQINKKVKNLDIVSLRALSEEIRIKIIDSVIKCGGHLS